MSSSADTPDAVLLNGLDLAERPLQEARRACMSLLTDRGLHYGDGLFETIACRDGQARFLGEHLERLELGCERLSIELGSRSALIEDIGRLAAGTGLALIKVLVTRGPATARGYAPRGDERASQIVLRYGWPAEDPRLAGEGVSVRIADLAIAENPRLAGLKHLNRLEQVLARAELRGSGCEEALLFSRSGSLVSGTMSNVFVVSGSMIATPRLDRCGVAGVMRRIVLRAAAEAGIEIAETRITRQDLEAADEMFLTNVRIGIWPVRALGARALGKGPVTQQLQRLIEPLSAAGGPPVPRGTR
ncbi:MAG TPA: aminodeoxychorismate lyase [Steroidobacteraceae bacterium]|nr:aminodeoxychorismate lyase [Steroidobacteraceae bacterium]